MWVSKIHLKLNANEGATQTGKNNGWGSKVDKVIVTKGFISQQDKE